jgi:hypothetical protein
MHVTFDNIFNTDLPPSPKHILKEESAASSQPWQTNKQFIKQMASSP